MKSKYASKEEARIIAIERAKQRLGELSSRVEFVNETYDQIESVLAGRKVNGVLLDLGVSSIVESIIRFKNDIYIATHNDVWVLEDNKFRKITNFGVQTWSLLKFTNPSNLDEEHLILGSSQGLFEIVDK